jgi:FkbM family methyltransferase
MQRLLRSVISACRAILRTLSTNRQRVPWYEKIARGIVLVPVFGTMLVLLRVWAWWRGPLNVQATTCYAARFQCQLPDMIQLYLYVFGVWEPDLTQFIHQRLQPGDTFIDVGANIGYHTLLAASKLTEGGRVVAIESSPKIYQLLQASLADNGSPSCVRTVNQAAAESVGTLPLYSGPDKNIGLSTTVGSRGLPSEGEIPAAPLADLLETPEIETARLVKIDVEGAEVAVLRGMQSFLERCPDEVEIVVELSPSWWTDRSQSPQEVLQPLIDVGFHVYELANNLWPWRYLWSSQVARPRRIRSPLTKPVKRLDLVLSRVDAERL